MAVRGSAVHMNHNPTLYITELSPIFHNGCSSWTYLGKYILNGLKLNWLHT